MRQLKRVVIIGAGPGGLASAILLAHAGLDVTILERHNVVGGRTTTIEAGGFRFDLGPTFFLYPRVLGSIYAAVGRDLLEDVPMVRLDPQYHLIFGAGGELKATPNVPEMERAIAALSPDDARQFRRFLADNRIKMNEFRRILESPFLNWRDLLSPQLIRVLPHLRPWLSLDGELLRYFRDPRIRLAMTFQSKYLGMSPFNCPSLFSILSFLEYEYGVYHPLGGCGAVSRAMADLARSLGVVIQLGDEVQEILLQGRRAVGVRSTSGIHPADAIVINADFARAMTRLIPNSARRRWTDERIGRKKFSCSTFMLYLGIDGLEDRLAHHTIYLAEDYAQNLADIETHHRLSEDPSFYVQNACVTDPSLAPKGRSTLYVLIPVTHQHPNVDWSVEAPRYRKKALEQLEKIGIRNLDSRICYERILTPADWDRGHQIHLGATFNLAHSLSQMLHLRPRNRFEDLDAVYLVGGGTHPGSGLPVIYESARITSRLIGEDLGVQVKVDGDLGSDPTDLRKLPHSAPRSEPRLSEVA